MTVQHRRGEGVHGGGVGHVGRHRGGLDAGGGQFGGGPRQGGLLHVGQDEAAASGTEPVGDASAQAAGRAGDHRHLSLEGAAGGRLRSPAVHDGGPVTPTPAQRPATGLSASPDDTGRPTRERPRHSDPARPSQHPL